MNAICGDDRFELIAKAREKIIESTNIENSQEEMAVLDSILFRCWQMGWLDQLRDGGDIRTKNARAEELAHGGVVSESYIRLVKEGPVCPVPRASVTFKGQKFTFDAEDSKRFAKLLEGHLRKLAGSGSGRMIHVDARYLGLTANQLAEIATDLKAENAKLREELAKARDPQRIGGQADRSSFVYAIEQLREFRWQHATNDEDAIPYINNVAAAHERENAKLKDFVLEVFKCARTGADCEKCKESNDGYACVYVMRSLGIDEGD